MGDFASRQDCFQDGIAGTILVGELLVEESEVVHYGSFRVLSLCSRRSEEIAIRAGDGRFRQLLSKVQGEKVKKWGGRLENKKSRCGLSLTRLD